nr:MAG TPA: hypothetical protein [Caudoviricetes sp.]
MSKSKANELLQYLVRELMKLWSGKGSDITATKAYKICEEIVKESKEQ